MAEGIVTFTDATFDEGVGGADSPVLVDFWAEWCGPCKMIAPVLEEIAKEHGDRITVVKVNVDENPRTAARFDARSIPVLAMVRGGETVGRIVGAQPERVLAQRIDALLAD